MTFCQWVSGSKYFKDLHCFICSGEAVKSFFWTPQPLEMKALQSFATSVTTCLVRQHCMREDLKSQQPNFEIQVFVFKCKNWELQMG